MAQDEQGRWKPDDAGFKRISQEKLEEPGGDCSPTKRDSYPQKCSGCHMTVIIHCRDCGVQTTGCLCLVYEQYGSDALEFERQVRSLQDKGLTLPKGFDPRSPTDPNRLH